MTGATVGIDTRSMAELTAAVFGEPLSMDEVLRRIDATGPPAMSAALSAPSVWVGSVGYEQHKDNAAFAIYLKEAGVERLIDVRELPISRRRGYAKGALGKAMDEAGLEYVHIRALGNPKPFRDLYKQGRVEEGRSSYERHLLETQRPALESLVPLLREKRSALMCFEHDGAVCHRTVILAALREELGLQLDVAELA